METGRQFTGSTHTCSVSLTQYMAVGVVGTDSFVMLMKATKPAITPSASNDHVQLSVDNDLGWAGVDIFSTVSAFPSSSSYGMVLRTPSH